MIDQARTAKELLVSIILAAVAVHYPQLRRYLLLLYCVRSIINRKVSAWLGSCIMINGEIPLAKMLDRCCCQVIQTFRRNPGSSSVKR